MLSDESIESLESHAKACDEARASLEEALDAAEAAPNDASVLQSVADALTAWQSAQKGYMRTVRESEVPDVPTAAMLLKQNAGVDSSNARCGIPGAHVDGTDQPFGVDVTGARGQALTTAAMEYVDAG